jgi:hypothetical protein
MFRPAWAPNHNPVPLIPKDYTMRLRTTALPSAAIAAALILSGCSTSGATVSEPSPGMSFAHVHELAADELAGGLLVGTHEGLYRLLIDADGATTVTGPLGGLDFDPMGFTIAEDTAYASGHPGPTTPEHFGTPNLGLISSTDLGETWTNVSLVGVTDFHALAVMTTGAELPHVFGLDPGNPRIQRSTDGGLTWSDGAELVARDILVIDTALYATTPEGLAISQDDGMTFTVDPTAPALYLVAEGREGALAGIDTTGTLWTRGSGEDWSPGGTVSGTPQALAVDGTRIYVADDRGVAFTEDAGATWIVLAVRG